MPILPPSVMGPGTLHKPLLATGPSTNKQSLQWNQVAVSLARQSPTLWWVMGVLTGWSAPLAHWVEVIKPAFPLNSIYEVFAQGLLIGGICPVATTGQEGCNTFSQPGNWFRGFFSLVGSLVTSVVASLTGESACVGWAPLGWLPWFGLQGIPPEEPCNWIHPHQWRRCNTSSPPWAPLHSPPKGMVGPQQADWLFLPKTGGHWCRPPSSPTAVPWCPSRQIWS